jgi:hypothetical protein
MNTSAAIADPLLLRVTRRSSKEKSLSGCRKIRFIQKIPLHYDRGSEAIKNLRMLKKAVQQGRSERRGEVYASVR